MADYPEAELEDSLRRAFVIHHADFIVLYDKRHRFLMESAGLGERNGWLQGEIVELDEQSTEWRFRLTDKGREHFGLIRAK